MTPERIAQLTPRERECLALVAENFSSKEIARKLDLSPYTVNEYIASARAKLGASSRAEAARLITAEQTKTSASPQQLGDDPQTLVTSSENTDASSSDRRHGSRRWQVPFLRRGRQYNDLTIFQRLAWIVIGSVAIIILFAQLAQGMQVIQNMLQGR